MPLSCQESLDDYIPCSWPLVIQEVAKGRVGGREHSSQKNPVISSEHDTEVKDLPNLWFVDISVGDLWKQAWCMHM